MVNYLILIYSIFDEYFDLYIIFLYHFLLFFLILYLNKFLHLLFSHAQLNHLIIALLFLHIIFCFLVICFQTEFTPYYKDLYTETKHKYFFNIIFNFFSCFLSNNLLIKSDTSIGHPFLILSKEKIILIISKIKKIIKYMKMKNKRIKLEPSLIENIFHIFTKLIL